MRKELTREQAITKAREVVVNSDGGSQGRKWLVGAAPHCYNNSNYQTEIHVLEGSPARGYVLDMGVSSGGTVLAINMLHKVLRRFEYRKSRDEYRFENNSWVINETGKNAVAA